MEPKQRAESNQRIILEFNKDPNNDVIKINGQRNASGAVLNSVKISLGDGSVFTKDGTFNFKNKIKNPAIFKDWVFVYSLSNRPEYDNSDADKAVALFQQCSKAFGISVKDPGFITVSGRGV